jgi:hypothetical protein
MTRGVIPDLCFVEGRVTSAAGTVGRGERDEGQVKEGREERNAYCFCDFGGGVIFCGKLFFVDVDTAHKM